MEKVLFVARRFFRTAGVSLLLALTFKGVALAQQVTVAGTVTTTTGTPLQGVTVRVQGSDVRATTGPTGKYTLNAPSNAVLTFSRVGQKPVQVTVAGRSAIDVTMAQISYLEEVVVTGYTEQRRGDITGGVSSVNVEATQRQSGASVLQRLDAAVPGVTSPRAVRRAHAPASESAASAPSRTTSLFM